MLFSAPTPPVYFATLAGPIAPGAAANMSLVLRADDTIPLGRYNSAAEIVSALDATDTRIHDSDAVCDTLFDNDTIVDDMLDNTGGDEDDSDIAPFGIGEVASTPDDLKLYLPVLAK